MSKNNEHCVELNHLSGEHYRVSRTFDGNEHVDLVEMSEDDIVAHAIAILEARLQVPEHYVKSPHDTRQYLRCRYDGLEYESFGVMFLDNQHGLIQYTEMFRGTIDGASVHPREVVKASLKFNAAALILSHNHPSGIATPSQADRRITERLKSALLLIDVRVLDHIIVGAQETYSFAEHGLV